jgi:endonuclease YncB( thermonuclease family)
VSVSKVMVRQGHALVYSYDYEGVILSLS